MAMVESEHQKSQVKYAQQHLANERTYLAWIRTAVAIIGIGFLTTSLHFTIGKSQPVSDTFAVVLGIFAGCFGILTIITATVSYFRKRRQIQLQIFYSAHFSVLIVSLFLIVVTVIAILYFIIG